MLVVAGPGAGKTYCLIARIGHLIAWRGLPPADLRRHLHQQGRGRDRRPASARHRPGGRRHHPRDPPRAVLSPAPGPRRGAWDCAGASASPTRTTSGGCSGGSGSGRSARTSSSRLFGRHRLQHVPLTAGDRSCSEAYRDGAPRPEPARLRRPHRPRRRAAARRHAPRRRTSGPAGTAILVDEFQDLSLAQYEVVTELTAAHIATVSPWATTSSPSSPGPAPTPRSWSASGPISRSRRRSSST